MTGPQLHTALLAAGVTLHLDANGKLHCTPPAAAQPYRAAIGAHLPYLLVCAAVAEVQRLMEHTELPERAPSTDALAAMDTACQAGDVEATRRAAVAYVQAWRAWLKGDDDAR